MPFLEGEVCLVTLLLPLQILDSPDLRICELFLHHCDHPVQQHGPVLDLPLMKAVHTEDTG